MAKNKTLYRAATFNSDSIDSENRTLELSFSSDALVERFDHRYGGLYFEVLGHDGEEVDMSFINSGRAPLLRDHDPLKQIGVVATVSVSEGRGRAQVKLSQNEEGQREMLDIVDGIRQNISVGYHIKQEKVVGERDGRKIVRATRWRPVEISTVSIPADESVGIGRADESETEITTPIQEKQEETQMENVENKTLNVEEITREARKSEQARVREINALGSKFSMSKQADEFVRNDKSAEEFRAYVLENMDLSARNNSVKAEKADDASIGMTDKEIRQYSIMKAIRSQIDPSYKKDAGFEIEASRAAAEKNGQEVRGILIPHDVLFRNNLKATDAGNGQNVVATDLLAGSFIELLRSKVVVAGLGATFLSGLRGNIQIPKATGAATAYWLTPEGAAVANSEQTLTQVTMAPKTVAGRTEFTRQLMMQSSVDVENFVKADLAKVLAIAIDKAALYGNTAGAPVGIANTAGIHNSLTLNANTVTYSNVVTMEAAVEVANALDGTLAYLVSPARKGQMKTQTIDSGSGRFVWDKNEVNGYKAVASSIVNSTDVYFGDWSSLLIGLWGGLDIVVDPYALSTSGGVRIVAFQSCDVKTRHPESFSYAK